MISKQTWRGLIAILIIVAVALARGAQLSLLDNAFLAASSSSQNGELIKFINFTSAPDTGTTTAGGTLYAGLIDNVGSDFDISSGALRQTLANVQRLNHLYMPISTAKSDQSIVEEFIFKANVYNIVWAKFNPSTIGGYRAYITPGGNSVSIDRCINGSADGLVSSPGMRGGAPPQSTSMIMEFRGKPGSGGGTQLTATVWLKSDWIAVPQGLPQCTVTTTITDAAHDGLWPVAYSASQYSGTDVTLQNLWVYDRSTDNSGVSYAYYENGGAGYTVLPDYSGLSATTSGVSRKPDIENYKTSGRLDNYGFVWRGYIQIDTPGTYTFELGSDDGGKFYWDQDYSYAATATVSADGLHAASPTISNSVASVTVGLHQFAFSWFQATGGAEASLYYTGPSLTRRLIPPSAFFTSTSVPAAIHPGSTNIIMCYAGSSTYTVDGGSGTVPTNIRLDTLIHNSCVVTNISGAVGGSKTADWLPGQTNYENLKTSVQAASGGLKIMRVMIGSNDAKDGVSLGTFKANIQSIVDGMNSWPVDMVILEEIGVRLDGSQPTLDLIYSYNQARSSISGARVGKARTFNNQATHLDTLGGDNIHQTDTGSLRLADFQALELSLP